MASIIPEVLNHFNIYNGANALVGVSGEVELPELEAITDTVEGTTTLCPYLLFGCSLSKSMQLFLPFLTLSVA